MRENVVNDYTCSEKEIFARARCRRRKKELGVSATSITPGRFSSDHYTMQPSRIVKQSLHHSSDDYTIYSNLQAIMTSYTNFESKHRRVEGGTSTGTCAQSPDQNMLNGEPRLSKAELEPVTLLHVPDRECTWMGN